MRRTIALLVAGVLCAGVTAAAAFQRRGGFGFSPRAQRFATPEDFDGSFQFCRVVFREAANGDGGGWDVDFPRADQNLSIRLSELTKTWVSMDADGLPNHLLVNLSDPIIFHCPFIMMTEVGRLYFTDEEAV